MMDDIAEQQQLAGEISTAISNPVGFDQDVDEVNKKKFFFKQRAVVKFFSYFFKDELLRELEELQDHDLEDELLNIPAAPSHNLPQPQTSGKGKLDCCLLII